MKILITNIWGNNRGDEAQADALIAHIINEQIKPEISCFLANDKSLEINNPIKKLPFITSELLGNDFITRDDLYYNLCERVVAEDKYDLFIEAPHGPDIGDLYTNRLNYGVSAGRLAKHLSIPIHFAASSYGPFLKDIPYRKEVLSYSNSIVAREPLSYEYLVNYVPELRDKIHLGIDWVFASNEADFIYSHNDIFMKEQTILQSEDYIGATINPVPIRRIINDNKKETNACNNDELASFFDKVIELSKMKLAFFSHIYPIDSKNITIIVNKMKHNKDVHIINQSIKWFDIVKLMKHLKFFISFRYHPTIFAIKAQIPFTCVMNQHKTEGMLRMLGLEEFSLYEDEGINNIYNIFCSCWNKRLKIVDSILESKHIVENKTSVNRHILNDFMRLIR